MKNNQIQLCGIIRDPFYSEERVHDGLCYTTYIAVRRNSGVDDVLQVVIPAEILGDNARSCVGREVFLDGEFRSRNHYDGVKRRLELFVFVHGLQFCDETGTDPDLLGANINTILLVGTVCRPSAFRRTPSGRRITDFLLAVNRNEDGDHYSDYIPCICWHDNAERYAELTPGDCIFLVGRAQSRQYTKTYEDGRMERRTAYEISAGQIRALGRVELLQYRGKLIGGPSPAVVERVMRHVDTETV